MKKLLIAFLSFMSLSAFANECRLVVPFPPGGSTDLYATALRKGNSKFLVDYKPGAYSAVAVAHLDQNKDHFIITNPALYSAGNPNKNPNVELYQILFGIDLSIVTGKGITLDDLLTKKLSIGVPGLGQSQHLVALQLKEKNPQLEIIPTGNDAKTLPLLINKDLDAYVSGSVIADKWISEFKTLSNVIEVPFNKPITRSKVTLTNMNFIGIFISKDATAAQRAHIDQCLSTATSSTEYKENIESFGFKPLNIKGVEKDKLLDAHIKWLRKHDH